MAGKLKVGLNCTVQEGELYTSLKANCEQVWRSLFLFDKYMRQILLVEDSTMFGRVTKKKLEKVFDVPVYWIKTLKDTRDLLDKADDNFSMALLDVNLPDAPNGEVIDEVIGRGISAFVFTSNITEDVRKLVWSKKVADYILKDDPNSLDYIVTAMKRVDNNENNLILVVDGLSQSRTALSELLYVQRYRVVTARDAKTALGILEQYEEIKLVITEYNLPDMDGWMFCQKIREIFKHDDLAIIGIAAKGGKEIGARFIKSGANDFLLRESFMVEEFYCRVTQCVENINLLKTTKDIAVRDHLTGLYNRRYFFNAGRMLFSSSKRNQITLVCAMLDVDHFKNVNDTYGHDVGDRVLKKIAEILPEKLRATDIVARIGGEEFCILAVNMTVEGAQMKFEELRRRIEQTQINIGDGQESLQITISIGVCTEEQEDLEKLMKAADKMLYRAKGAGRNQVMLT